MCSWRPDIAAESLSFRGSATFEKQQPRASATA
eukprot:CAMPEP_0173306962 /NCGR_PEP_ID=MMETSP1143-20121109/20877_1 /TAXON_ID=483371 /ORGANISM="non described non described, Strain CCMP2298" /LENGTH=32 /DNA_ID= /DNA_START= /DNA_END= /DNA_ORIENTATION=